MIRSFADPACVTWRGTVREWLGQSIPADWERTLLGDPAVVEQARREWDRTLFDAGYAGLSWPRKYGGRGLGPIEEAIFAEECAHAHAPQGFAQIGRTLVGPTLMRHGSSDQIDRFLPGILNGQEIWCQGYSEPDAGSDLAAMLTSAVREGDKYLITGRKIWTSFAQYADWCLLLARTAPEGPRYRNLSLLMVSMHQPTVSVVPIRQITGECEFNETHWNGAVALVRDRIGGENDGWNVAMSSLMIERGPESMLRRYSDMRLGIDRLITCCRRGDSTATVRIGRLESEATILRWNILRAVELRMNDGSWLPVMSICKVVTTELEQELAGVGLSMHCPVHEAYWRHRYLYSFAGTIAGGSNEIQRNIIAERVLGLPR